MPAQGALSDDAVWRLSVWRMTSVAYIRSAGGACGRPAGWRVLADRASCRCALPLQAWAGHIVATARLQLVYFIMPPPLIDGCIKRRFCLTSDVCLSRTSGLSREQRGLRRLKLAQVAHVTRDSDTTFKVKMSKVKVTRPLWLVVLAGQHGHTVMVTYHMRTTVSQLARLGGDISWRPRAYSLFILFWRLFNVLTESIRQYGLQKLLDILHMAKMGYTF